ncbi:MAG: hypothetical protein V8R63_03035 [Thomasclavelia ramosa]
MIYIDLYGPLDDRWAIVTSLNFFRDQKLNDLNKQKLDGIAEYVDNEINYVTDLAIDNEAPILKRRMALFINN